MSSRERAALLEPAIMPQIEIAAALQAVYFGLPGRDFIPEFYQREAIEALGFSLVTGVPSGYIESFTGSGKTLEEVLLAEAAIAAGQSALIVTPTVGIANQIYGKGKGTGFERFAPNLLEDRKILRKYGVHDDKMRVDEPHATITTYAGMLNEYKRTLLPPVKSEPRPPVRYKQTPPIKNESAAKWGKFGVIIGDECHMSLGEQTAEAMKNYMPGVPRIGFSASPDFAEDRKSEEVFGKRIYEFSLPEAIAAGKTPEVRTLLYETEDTIYVTDPQRDFTDRELAPLIDNRERNLKAMELARDLVADGRQGIISCVPGSVNGKANAHATALAKALSTMEVTDQNGRKRSLIAVDVGSHLPAWKQKAILEAYKNGRIDVLTFTKTLEVGWDSDRANFCINLSPTTSRVRIIQLLGRILRFKSLKRTALGLIEEEQDEYDVKESIFIDFVDRKMGITKSQYTAVHAVGEDTYDVHRILGRSRSGNVPKTSTHTKQRQRDLSEIFEAGVLRGIVKGQGRLVKDILMGALERPNDPLIAEWNRILARDEKPPLVDELPFNPTFTPGLEAAIKAAYRKLSREAENPDEVTIEDVYAAVGRNALEILGTYGHQISYDELTADSDEAIEYPDLTEWDDLVWDDTDSPLNSIPDPETRYPSVFNPERYIASLGLTHSVNKILETLSEREAGTIRLRYDTARMTETGERNLDDIGRVYAVTRERVRQILSKTMSKLMHPARSWDFRPYMYSDEETALHGVRPRTSKRWHQPDVFDDIVVPVIDKQDPRSYNERLRSECGAWLVMHLVDTSTTNPITRGDLIKLAPKIKPDSIRIHSQAIHTPEEAIEHYKSAMARLDAVNQALEGRYLGQRVGNLVQAKVVSAEDLELALNVHDDSPGKVSSNRSYGLECRDLLEKIKKTRILYTQWVGAMEADPESFWQNNEPGVTRGYQKTKLLQAAIVRAQSQDARELAGLERTRRRILNRPHPGTSVTAQEASLMIVDTKITYVRHRMQRKEQSTHIYVDPEDTDNSPYIYL